MTIMHIGRSVRTQRGGDPMERAGRDMRPRVFGRPLKPFSLFLTMTLLVIVWSEFFGRQPSADNAYNWIGGGLAAISTILLIGGWAFHKQKILMAGLVGVMATYLARAIYIAIVPDQNHLDQALVLSLVTAASAGLAYYLEAIDNCDMRQRKIDQIASTGVR